MTDYRDSIPAYRTIHMTAPATPVASLTDEEAWRARERYPAIVMAGGPIFGVAREREAGGWQLHPHFSAGAPQDARDSMASHFRWRAHEAGRAGEQEAAEECAAAAERLDWEALDEMTVGGTRYRVVRAEPFVRTGPDGPEPPRPSDPDPAAVGRSHELPDPTDGFVIDTTIATGMSEGILKTELLALVPVEGAAPSGVRADAERAAHSHPGGVLLPPTYLTAEDVNGRWVPDSAGVSATPQAARDALAMHLRVLAPVTQLLDDAAREEYARAADRLDGERGADLEFAGRRLRVVRVERLVRVGPDGPEGPRPSDPDPQPPVMVHDQQLRRAGLLGDGDGAAPEPSQELADFRRLWEKEQARQERRDAEQ